ncbi:tyrosine-type recombinase/integrase [Methanococcus maripaludis]|uniref:Integrase/recombinase XerD n=1 Tax=Methanococcus maripaludis TaxID=39152 RepID=A0A7J9S0D2_METMI|nr:site-specific integrase [Methanococcus maripaludis]MBB6067931.1 integrase/recombinase XerD [Methanococcus maripaludis]
MDLKKAFQVSHKRETVNIQTKESNEWAERFKAEREFDGRKSRTIETDMARLGVFLSFSELIGKQPDEMEVPEFVKFFNYLKNERNLAKSSIKRYYNLLKVFYRSLRLTNFNTFSEESVQRNRFQDGEMKPYDPILEEDLNQIMGEIIDSRSRTKIRDALIIRLLWDSGARLSEVLNLRFKDCDLKSGNFRVTDTKTKRERMIICSQGTLELLNSYLHIINRVVSEDSHIFQSMGLEDDKMVNRSHLSRVMKRHVTDMKNKKLISPEKRIVVHSLRHGRCFDLLEKGVPIEQVKELLGHSDIHTTLRYAHAFKRTKDNLENIRKLL